MTHPDPEHLERHLLEARVMGQGSDSVPLRYFIPYLVLARQKVTTAGRDTYTAAGQTADREKANNEIRNALRRFVFLQASESDINALLKEPWNQGHHRLHYYKDASGHIATISGPLMQQFIHGCMQQRERFDIHPHTRRIEKGMTVTIRRGAFKDLTAEVYEITHTASGIRMTLSVEFFGGTQDLRLYDKTPDDIYLDAADEPMLFQSDYLLRMQQVILTALEHKVTRYSGLDADEERRADMRKLNILSISHTVESSDPLLLAQYDALMLMCASLQSDRAACSLLNGKVKAHIKALEQYPQSQSSLQPAEVLAYLYIALFVSTKDPAYRKAAKSILRTPSPHTPHLSPVTCQLNNSLPPHLSPVNCQLNNPLTPHLSPVTCQLNNPLTPNRRSATLTAAPLPSPLPLFLKCISKMK